MKNKDLFDLFTNLSAIKDLQGVRFNYAIAKNISTLKPEITSFQESVKPTEEFNKYDNERLELAKKHSKKDEAGEPIIMTINGQQQYDIEDLISFNKEFEKLKKSYEKIISAREKQLKDFEDLLDVSNPIELHKIKLSDIPENISTEQLKGIYSLIEE